ncbi:HAMP domain-containing histidine kinase [Enterovibrio sp. ZSDZ35]|uniref:histidine kinase n=1 Tax=Enterovibrio qingdaonensis TaxID=2899818 RepID=A0ABT5QGE5_9GAMM|nr:HAMP domain-containing sensor histidine kinase [Enterovibrio sp. ZSDZ35]MDD1780053.1 HAMP domain-containing histidine kinase [Enterovibrio sp. ZSDZ35]
MAFKHRLLLFTSVWFLVSAAILTLLSVSVWEENELRTQQSLHRELAVHMRDDNPLMVGDDYSPNALSSIFHTLMLLGPDFEIYFLDPDGNITTSGPPIDDVLQPQIDTTPIKQFLAGQPFPILGEDPLMPGRKKVFSAAQIDVGEDIAGYLYVVIGSQQRIALDDPTSLLQYIPVVAGALIAILFFALVVYRMVYRQIISPGKMMVKQIEDAALSEFRITPPLQFNAAELQELAAQYRRMMAIIQQQFIQLRVQEAQRREHLVQLSHDLKTPLANILGYLETWRIQHKEGQGMIDTAYHNALRLQQRLNEQLEAARSPSAKVVLSYQGIGVLALLTEVKKRFDLSLTQKQIEMSIIADPKLAIMADEQLINRVFDNLIENAVRHSPAQSKIKIEGKRKGSTRIVFQIQNSIDQHSTSGSLGMGTKIVEAILSLHQTTLHVAVKNSVFLVTFELSANTLGVTPIQDIPQELEEDTPPLTSHLPHVHAQRFKKEEGDKLDNSETLHVFAQDKEGKKGEPLPSFNAHGVASVKTPEDDETSNSETKE